jgi:LysM repeat protein/ABC-type branched-subunit amino acid transport system substrate-binding protein
MKSYRIIITILSKLNLFRFSLLFLLSLLLSNTYAQQVQPVVEIIDGNKYYIHKIEKGNTLYAISKKYMVDIDVIIQENPAIKDGFKIDQVIKIPVKRQNKNLEKANAPAIKADSIFHKVEKGQTLYSLAKTYNLDIAALVEANPGIQNSMKLDQIIFIPVVKVKDVAPIAVQQAKDDLFLRHIVEKGETLFSLSSKYQLSADSIALINNGLPGGLRVGESIIIPKKDLKKIPQPKVDHKKEINGKFVKKKLTTPSGQVDSLKLETYSVALILPFNLDENQVLNENKKEFEKDAIAPSSAIGLSFYQGFLFALDSLTKAGLSVRLFVYDAGKDPSVLKDLTSKPELSEMDLIIGPLYSPGFSVIAEFAQANKINIVSPFSNNVQLLQQNPYVSKPTASQATRLKEAIAFISKNYSKENIILVNSGSEADKELVSVCSNHGKNLLAGKKYKELAYSESKLAGLKENLSATQNNIILVPSVDQAFVTQFITNINYWIKDYQITLVGVDSWLDFDNLDLSYLDKLNTHFPTSFFIDYDALDTKNFIKSYRTKNFVDPDHYALHGFDIACYYLSSLFNSGLNLQKTYTEKKHKGLQTTFNLTKFNATSGFENQGVYILKYDNYKLVKVN